MFRMEASYRGLAAALVAAAAMTLGACSLDKQEPPPLAGPSEIVTSLSLTASPDQLPRDGSSQSIVTIVARDANGQPLVGQRITLALGANAPAGAALSQSEVTTGSNGTATFAVTAPASGSIGDIIISATPVGTNAGNAATRIIQIRATPGNTTAPTAAFSFSPATPDVGQTVTFNASTSTDEGVACSNCSFFWNFGGDGTATGVTAQHAFSSGGSFLVTLTVSDAAGSSSTAQQTITVSAPSIPTALSVSPTTATAKLAQTFTASATAAPNHRITSYQFVWGDGDSNTQNSPVIQHTYGQAGSFLLTLTVRDDLGQSATANQVITVSSGLTASFTVTVAGTTASFDASASSSATASTITDYAWDFENDGTYDTNGSSPTVSHDYGSSGTRTAKLRITDNRGVTQTATQTVTIP
jgi:PKD repeat protein